MISDEQAAREYADRICPDHEWLEDSRHGDRVHAFLSGIEYERERAAKVAEENYKHGPGLPIATAIRKGPQS